jgi:uncharacterized protein YdeI (YjbR/CyaY-like superfamily)
MKIASVNEYLERGCGRCQHFDSPACKVHRWGADLAALRQICLESGLTEDLKWSHPCYTHGGKNIALIGAFNDFCSLSFFKGALLADPAGLLTSAGENTQSARLVRITDGSQIAANEASLRALIAEAIAVEVSGRKVASKPVSEYAMPDELAQKFAAQPALRVAFEALTPGRQKAYLLHFAQPKQSATRTSRIEKVVERILAGKGLYD